MMNLRAKVKADKTMIKESYIKSPKGQYAYKFTISTTH